MFISGCIRAIIKCIAAPPTAVVASENQINVADGTRQLDWRSKCPSCPVTERKERGIEAAGDVVLLI